MNNNLGKEKFNHESNELSGLADVFIDYKMKSNTSRLMSVLMLSVITISPQNSYPDQVENDSSTNKIQAGETVCIDTTATEGDSVQLNVTATDPSAAGYVNVTTRLAAQNGGWTKNSKLNFAPGQTIANAIDVIAGPEGEVCATPLVPTHIIMDVEGHTLGEVVRPESSTGAVRSLDSRGRQPIISPLSLLEATGSGYVMLDQITTSCTSYETVPGLVVKQISYKVTGVPQGSGVIFDTTRLFSLTGSGGAPPPNQQGEFTFNPVFYPVVGGSETNEEFQGVITFWTYPLGQLIVDKSNLPKSSYYIDIDCTYIGSRIPA